MDDSKLPNKPLCYKQHGRRNIGRSKIRWFSFVDLGTARVTVLVQT